MRKTTLLVCGAALAAVTLTACSGTPSTSTPSGAGSTSAAAETKSGKGTFDSLRALSDAVTEKSDNAKSSHVTFSGTVAGTKIDGEGDLNFNGDSVSMQMTMSVAEAGGEVTLRLIDKIMYMKMPAPMQPGKPWLKLDLSDPNNPLAAGLGGALDSAKGSDPRETLKQLAEAGEIKSVKDDEIDGKATKHYTLVVDVTKMAKDNGLGVDETTIKEMGKTGMKELPVEVWIDEDSLPVRLVMDIPAGKESGKIQTDYSDWGKAVKVEAPPAAEVMEFPKMPK
jgi:hypothetical protein